MHNTLTLLRSEVSAYSQSVPIVAGTRDSFAYMHLGICERDPFYDDIEHWPIAAAAVVVVVVVVVAGARAKEQYNQVQCNYGL